MGGEHDGVGVFGAEGCAVGFGDAVHLVEDEAGGDGVGADLAEDVLADAELHLVGGVGGVDDEEEEGGLEGFGEGGAEGGDEVVGELLDEADGVGDQDAGAGLGLEGADSGVEGGEELVLDEDFATCEGAHEGGFAGVGVADEGHSELVAAGGAALVVILLDGGELLAEFGEAVAYFAAVEGEVGFAGAGALLAAAAGGGFAEAGGDVFEPCHFDLELGFAAVGVAVEDLDDDAGAVEHAGTGGAFEVAGLAGGDVVVDDDVFGLGGAGFGGGWGGVGGRGFEAFAGLGFRHGGHGGDDAGAAGHCCEFLELAAAEDGGATGAVAVLGDFADDVVTEGFDEAAQFFEACGVGDVVDARELDADEDRPRGGEFGFHGRDVARGRRFWRPWPLGHA